MKTRIVHIGNAHGIHIPTALLKAAGLALGSEVEIIAGREKLTIRKAIRPREGWAEAFEEMASRGDDALIDGIGNLPNAWDLSEWEWR